MGGAADFPQRASSPLKRRASDLEAESSSSQKDDVDMINVPESEPAETVDASIETSARRAQSVDMLKDDQNPDTQTTSIQTPEASPPKETEIPPIDFQIKTVKTLCEAASQHQLDEGNKTYLVSKLWLSRVTSRSTEARASSKVEPEGEIGPVDNSDIIQQLIKDCDGETFVQLKHGLSEESFELLPEDAWNLVIGWYGLMPGHIPIVRTAHNTNQDKSGIPNVIFEFHPPIFKVHRLWSETTNYPSQIMKVQKPSAPIFVVSRSNHYMDFLKRIKLQAGIDLERKVRVWRVPRKQPAAEPVAPVANTTTPPSSRPNSPGAPGVSVPREPQDSWTDLLLDVASFNDLEKGVDRVLIDVPKDETGNSKYNGRSDIAFAGLGEDQAIVLDEQVERESYVSNYVPKKPSLAVTRTGGANGLSFQSNSQVNSGRNSPVPSGYNLRGRSQKSGKVRGTVGLSNLGNTCYMNSALQCVRSVQELTQYFLSGRAQEELNSENPLAHNGDVAMAYEALLREIYKEPVPPSVAPRQFKSVIGKYAPSFSGYGQQDSQEFLGFLLDGLQEDLSRVKKKPYIEKPDSTDDMVNNPEAIREMAAKVWEITQKRDDSVIADLFTGMYKSTLVCPVCDKVSITFDPFNNLTLQLPIENSWSHDICYFPLNDAPLFIPVDMDKNGSILSLKQYMSKKVGVPVERLFLAEEFKCKFYKFYDDKKSASEDIGAQDTVSMYELEAKPTNWPAPRKAPKKSKPKTMLGFGNNYNESEEDDVPNWDSPLAEKLLVPVFYRHPNPDRRAGGYRKNMSLVPNCHFIIITPEEARSEEMIKRKILEKVVTFTTSSEFDEDDDEANDSVADSADRDIVIANGSDSSDGKVMAASIDSEDGLVDITMKEINGAPDSVEVDASKSSETRTSRPIFRTRRPKFLQPGSYLNPQFQNMFILGYFSTQKELVPTGWNTIDEDKEYPTLASRNPQLPQAYEDESETDLDITSRRAGSEGSNDDDSGHNYPFDSSRTRMAQESEEDEPTVPAPKVLVHRPVATKSGFRVGPGKGRARRMKTYSRKGNQSSRKLPEPVDNDQDAPDDGPLIRLGEGIVVDWNAAAFDALFGADSADDHMRGLPTYENPTTFRDTELMAKRTARSQRRKNGITLEDCLNEFGKEEILSEADTWYCPRCKEHRRATKKFELWKTPDILVMHLKRFSSSSTRRDKLDVFVDFPVEGLDLTSRVIETEEGKQEIYDLFAVDDHWGGLGGGHYTAFAKNFYDDKWYEYNDTSVSQKDPSQVVSQSAYLLFYRRRSDVPLGGPRFQEIYSNIDNSPEPSEDDVPESGEDQGLVANSSLRGSSSALTGVGAAHHRADLGSDRTVDPKELEGGLPPYQAHEDTPTLANEGMPMESIEDEGIDMENNDGMNYNNLSRLGLASTWNFSGLEGLNQGQNHVSGTGSEIDLNYSNSANGVDLDASDIVQNNSSASPGSIQGRLEDFDNAVAEGEDGEFVDPSPVPDIDDDAQIDTLALHRVMMRQRGISIEPEFKVTPEDEVEEVEEPATEIHVEEGEGLKMD